MRRALPAIVLVLVATGAGIAAASVVVTGEQSLEQEPDRLLPGPAGLMTGASLADPSGGADWAVRTYVSRTGLLCAERGRLVGGVFGDVDAEGRLEPRPPGPTGVCGDPGADHVIAVVERIPAGGEQPAAATIVYGASQWRPQAAVVSPDGASPVSLPIGARGTFIARFAGLRDARSLPVRVTLAGGEVVEVTWDSGS